MTKREIKLRKQFAIDLIVIGILFVITLVSQSNHYKKYYYHYSTETCLVTVENDKCVVTRPNGHMYEYDTDLLKEQRTFSILTFCDNGTPKNFEDDFVVFGK